MSDGDMSMRMFIELLTITAEGRKNINSIPCLCAN